MLALPHTIPVSLVQYGPIQQQLCVANSCKGSVSQAIRALSVQPVQYRLIQQRFCFTDSRVVSCKTESTSDSKVSKIASSIVHTAVSGMGQVFRWIDGFFPLAAFAQAHEIKSVSTSLTLEEQGFLGDLEAYVKLARIVPEDTRYLRTIFDMVEAYMKKNQLIAFPQHMSRALEVLSDLAQWQSIMLDDGVSQFREPEPLSESCFYHQVHAAVESAQLTRSLKERVVAARVVQLLLETYLFSNKYTLLPHDVQQQFGKLTDGLCGIFGRELLSKQLPYLIEDDSVALKK